MFLLCSLYGSPSVLNAVLPFSLVIPLITYILATKATLAVATAPQLHTGWIQLTSNPAPLCFSKLSNEAGGMFETLLCTTQ